MAYGTINADLMTTSDGVSSSGLYGFKNRLINGAMLIAQRGTTATSTNLWYPADRFRLAVSNSSKVNLSQSTTAPAGFVNSILATSLAATTVGSTDAYEISQQIEGYNIADLGWGTASAKTVTLSFWVRSSLTGTFGGVFENSGNTRAYPFSYTISAANTWEQKTITVAGDTSGTWLTDNSRGIIIRWSLGMGSSLITTANAWVAGDYQSVTGETKLVATNGATWYITGTQLEVGSTATSFDYRPYGTELALCQRYCNVFGENAFSVFGMMGWAFSTTGFTSITPLPVEMRAIPTLAYTGNTRAINGSTSLAITSASLNTSNSSKKIIVVEPSVASGLTINNNYAWSASNDATARVIFSAEL